jgi:hypothetical protein
LPAQLDDSAAANWVKDHVYQLKNQAWKRSLIL